jgi:trk system potassium uptake protein TrkH
MPHRALSLKYGNKTFNRAIVLSVAIFISLYFAVFFIMTALVTFTGLDVVSSLGAVAASMANSGPGLGDIVGPAGNYSSISPSAKYLLSFAMMLGRLEIIPVMVFFSRRYWSL